MSLFESKEIAVLSSFGSHSYVRTEGAAGIGPLFYREFSDWMPGGPLFDAVLALSLDIDGAALPLTRTSYRWQGDIAERKSEAKDGVTLDDRLGYIGNDIILAETTVRNESNRSLTVRLSGGVSDKASAVIHDASAHGFIAVQVKADTGHMWGVPLKLDEMFVIGVSQGSLAPSDGGSGYAMTLEVPAHTETTLRYGLAPRESADILFDSFENPARYRASMRRDLQEWMDELPLPAGTDETRARLCRQSWFWFWYSTQRAKGCWNKDILTPSRNYYGRGVWLWDSGFHIQALLLGGKRALQLAADQVEVLCHNLVEGHLPREVWVQTAGMDLQAPGILTWAALEIHKRTGDLDFLKRVYPALVSNNNWFYANRAPEDVNLCWWDRADSGWDTSPRWDDGTCLAVDLNSWLYLDHLLLAEMDCLIGGKGAEAWRAKAARTAELMRRYFWNEEDGCYYDVLLDSRLQTKVQSPALYWPLFAGLATQSEADRMAHFITDPKVLGTPWPMPCISLSHPAFEPDNYWRGPVWINLNWITILGLRRYGLNDLADHLTKKSLEVIEKNPVPHEYYNPHTGKGIGAPNYMWTAALHLVMALGESRAPRIG